MRSLYLATILMLLFTATSRAQEIRLNTYAGYVFEDRIQSYYSNTAYFDGQISAGFRWGLGLEYIIADYYGVELMYQHQDATVPTVFWDNGEKSRSFDMAINWIMLNGGRHMQKDKVDLYGGAGAGVGLFHITDPSTGKSDDATKFAWMLRLGANIFPGKTVGIKLQADLMSAVQAAGGGVYFGTGGVGTGVSTYSSMMQFAFMGGLVFKFHQGAKK
jgi:hypothetical protein